MDIEGTVVVTVHIGNSSA